MRKIPIIMLAAICLSTSSCKKFLDVNTNPNAPQVVSANLYLSPLLHWITTGPQYDGVFISRYTQNWASTFAGDIWEKHGYNQGTDQSGWLWRTVYYDFGQNLIDMNTKAEAEQRWDLLGVGQILKAWSWLTLTDVCGEIIVKEAFNVNKTRFNYDTQEYVYQEIQRLIEQALTNLNRTDGAVNAAYLGKTDLIYKGNRMAWIKFAQGLKAMALNQLSNKSSLYKPDDVIAAVNASFASNADDALLPYTGSSNDDANFLSATRNNISTLRQTRFILSLLDGTVFKGEEVDPRLSRMLSPSPDGKYRGLEPTMGVGALKANEQPMNLWGYADQKSANATAATPSRYLFARKSKFPIITYAQLQFIKAEAAYKKGDKNTAFTAYKNGVSAHIDFVNERNKDDNQSPSQISPAEKAVYLNFPSVTPPNPNEITLTQIMCQKYITQWGWAHVEQWMDLRRYHYIDQDPNTGKQVFEGFTFPQTFFADNQNKPVQRVRPRYNSEYIWNRVGLDAIGGLATNYQAVEMWVTIPKNN